MQRAPQPRPPARAAALRGTLHDTLDGAPVRGEVLELLLGGCIADGSRRVEALHTLLMQLEEGGCKPAHRAQPADSRRCTTSTQRAVTVAVTRR